MHAPNGRLKRVQPTRRAVAEWIDDYNRERRHSSIGQISPIAYELDLRRRAAGEDPEHSRARSTKFRSLRNEGVARVLSRVEGGFKLVVAQLQRPLLGRKHYDRQPVAPCDLSLDDATSGTALSGSSSVACPIVPASADHILSDHEGPVHVLHCQKGMRHVV